MDNDDSPLRLRFDIRSYWHCGSGEVLGPGIDAAIILSGEGLPYVPGRTVKGLLRDALRLVAGAGLVEQRDIADLLGQDAPHQPGDGSWMMRYQTVEGGLHIGNAVLPEEIRRFLVPSPIHEDDGGRRRDMARALRSRLGQTALAGGVARSGSLRMTEVAIPMELDALVMPTRLLTTSRPWRAIIAEALPFVRSLGGDRHRGLGRVHVTASTAPGGMT